MSELNLDGMALAPGVVETIVSIATHEVEGVASVGPASAGALRAMFGARSSMQGIDIVVGDDEKLNIAVRIDVYHGYVLPDLAANVRRAVADAVASQVGVQVGTVDVYIDGIQFAN